MEVIGILCNDKGEVIKKSSLLIDEEDEILEEAADIDIYDIDIIKRKKINKKQY